MIAIRDLSEAQIEQILDKTGISPFKGGYIYYNFEEPERYIWSIDKELIGKDKFYVVLDIFHRLESLRSQMNIDKVETQTEHQEEMSAFSGETEWNGEGLPPVGATCTVDPNHDIELLCKYSSKYVVIGEILPKERYNGVEVIIDTFAQRDRVFRKSETPQQREDRERLEAAYDLYCTCNSEVGINSPSATYEWFTCSKIAVDYWLRIVDKTNYRKG